MRRNEYMGYNEGLLDSNNRVKIEKEFIEENLMKSNENEQELIEDDIEDEEELMEADVLEDISYFQTLTRQEQIFLINLDIDYNEK